MPLERPHVILNGGICRGRYHQRTYLRSAEHYADGKRHAGGVARYSRIGDFDCNRLAHCGEQDAPLN